MTPVSHGVDEATLARDLTMVPRLRAFAWASGVLLVAFALPLWDLARFAFASDLYSHIFLIPVISGYLIWNRRAKLRVPVAAAPLPGVLCLVSGVAIVAAYAVARRQGVSFPEIDYLAIMMFALLLCLLGAAWLCLGSQFLRAAAFPVAFLALMIPFPTAVQDAIDVFFQHSSAAVANGLIRLLRIPVLREGLQFQLPGLTIEVAPQCSGIHSTLVLFITSLLAGQIFLKNPWRRLSLALFVIPLAALRNGLRIATISFLCVEIGPEMIHSIIHRRGGPLFFALSLIPFFGVLLLLRRMERTRSPQMVER